MHTFLLQTFLEKLMRDDNTINNSSFLIHSTGLKVYSYNLLVVIMKKRAIFSILISKRISCEFKNERVLSDTSQEILQILLSSLEEKEKQTRRVSPSKKTVKFRLLIWKLKETRLTNATHIRDVFYDSVANWNSKEKEYDDT